MQGEFSTLQLRDGFSIRKGSRVIVQLNHLCTEEVKIVRIFLTDNGMILVECVSRDGRGRVITAHNIASCGVLKKY